MRLFADVRLWNYSELRQLCRRFNLDVQRWPNIPRMADMLDDYLNGKQLKRTQWKEPELVKICRSLRLPDHVWTPNGPRLTVAAICSLINDVRAQGNANTTTCLVCDGEFSSHEQLETNCGHLIEYCPDCMEKWLSSQLATQLRNGVTCPADGCDKDLSPEDMEGYLPSETFDRSRQHYFAKIFGGFICPIENCRIAITTSEADKLTFTTCEGCQNLVCISCESQWHRGLSCREFQASLVQVALHQKLQEYASDQYKQTNTTSCPGCTAPVEKNGGCDHIKCTKCRTEFCYSCGANYSSIRMTDNSAHLQSCPHWRPPGDLGSEDEDEDEEEDDSDDEWQEGDE